MVRVMTTAATVIMRMVRIGMVMMIPTITLRSAVIGTMVSVTAGYRRNFSHDYFDSILQKDVVKLL